MITIPNPLHPALVHFPIALILIGALVAVLAAVLRGWHLPWLAAALMATGATGAAIATWTGGQQVEMVGKISDRAEALLDEHEEWGESTRNLALAAAILALASASLARFAKVARGLGVAAAIVAVAAAYAVARTGHYGGQLVYQHGVGINPAAGYNPANAEP
jgi:uncharacterized membrane protein